MSRISPLLVLAGIALVGAAAMIVPAFARPPEPSGDEPEEAAPSADGVYDVALRNSAFAPAVLAVPVGATVRWTNEDAVPHTVTPADKAQWGSEGSGDGFEDWLHEGDTWTFAFEAPGTYTYYCVPHAAKGTDGRYVGMVATVIVGGAAPEVADGPIAPPVEAPALKAPDADGVVRFTLETREVEARLADGVSYTYWTFDGTVPGPMLRVREGDTVEVTLKNAADSTMPHSIDLHAVTGPGGGAKATQTQPGGATSFTFKALNPGVYVYHCATPHIPTHVANGMYGMILVEPAEGLPPVDREFYVVQGEFYTEGAVGEPGAQAFSLEKAMDEDPEYVVFNGAVGSITGEGAMHAEVGEKVRIYFGVGAFLPSSFHVIGEVFDSVYPEGGFPPVSDVQTTFVPAGGATMVEFRVDYPGTYALVDHSLTRALDRGAAGHLVVEGPADPSVFEGAETAGSGH